MLRAEYILRNRRTRNEGDSRIIRGILFAATIVISAIIILWDLLPLFATTMKDLCILKGYSIRASSFYSDNLIFPENHLNGTVKASAAASTSLHFPDHLTRLIRKRYDRHRIFVDEVRTATNGMCAIAHLAFVPKIFMQMGCL